MDGTLSDWEKVREKPLGKGGQSTVFLVRRPERKTAREKSFKTLEDLAGGGVYKRTGTALSFAQATVDLAREEHPSELAALKIFDPRSDGPEAAQQAAERMRNEVIVLEQKRQGLVKILAHNLSENWIVTEYCSGGTLEGHLPRYKGNAKVALADFFALVKTVWQLHQDGIVHRDIKPQNIFIGDAGELLLGDFGIVFLPNQAERVSLMGESVGPRDFMPPWVFRDEQQPPKIRPAFDVYMLGKVLWCMVTGRMKLHREDFLEDGFDVVKLFSSDPYMHVINTILEKCVVSREQDCLRSAQDLFLMVGAFLEMMQRNGQPVRDGVARPCQVCGVGCYQRESDRSVALVLINGREQPVSPLRAIPFSCDRCGHIQIFKHGVLPLT